MTDEKIISLLNRFEFVKHSEGAWTAGDRESIVWYSNMELEKVVKWALKRLEKQAGSPSPL